MGRRPIEVNLESLYLDRESGMGYKELCEKYGFSSTATAYTKYQLAKAHMSEKARIQGLKQPIGFCSDATVGPVDTVDRCGPITPNPFVTMPVDIIRGTDSVSSEPEEVLRTDADFDRLYANYRAYLGWKDAPEVPEKVERSPDGEELWIVASDFHAPYHNDDAVQWMIKKTFRKAKGIIIGGDIADMFYFSKYMKFKQHFGPLEELMRVQALLRTLSEAYENVILMRGNHDDRFIKYLKRMGLPVEVVEVFDYLHGQHSLHPIYVLARGLPNVQVVEPVNKDFAEFGYLYQHGDAVISHAEKYSQQCNKAVSDVIHSLMSYHLTENVLQPFRVVVQCHTHQAGLTFCDYGVVGIENGCLSMTPDYTGSSKNLPRRRPVLGYTELYQVNGVSDLQKTRFMPYFPKK